MIRSRFGLKALLLSGFVLGLMAFGAAGAQAEEGSKWIVNGVDVGSLAPQLVVTEVENDSAGLFFETAGNTEVEILCTDAEFVEGGKLIAEGGISLGRVAFTGCIVLLNGVFAKNCKPQTQGEPVGEILSERGEGLLVLDEGASNEDLVLITPVDGPAELFAIVEMGELCAIGEEVDVKGEGLWIGDATGETASLTATVTHLIEEGLNGLFALGQPAELVGSAVIGLGGTHSTLGWKGDWS